jgi:hypothetical protein
MMRCFCGRVFAMEAKMRERKSFAVIADATYRRFLGLERKVQAATTREERLKAIARSARLVGSLWKCPACARLVFTYPGAEKVEYYQLEATAEE